MKITEIEHEQRLPDSTREPLALLGMCLEGLLSLGYNHFQNKTKKQTVLQLGCLVMSVKGD